MPTTLPNVRELFHAAAFGYSSLEFRERLLVIVIPQRRRRHVSLPHETDQFFVAPVLVIMLGHTGLGVPLLDRLEEGGGRFLRHLAAQRLQLPGRVSAEPPLDGAEDLVLVGAGLADSNRLELPRQRDL